MPPTSMLATKISLMNEFANLADRVGADIEEVRRGIGADPRIGHHFIYPGLRLRRLVLPEGRTRSRNAWPPRLATTPTSCAPWRTSTSGKKHVLAEKLLGYFGRVPWPGAPWRCGGWSFKPDTDDMREAPSRTLMEAVWSRRRLHPRLRTPQATEEARRLYGDRDDLVLCRRREDAPGRAPTALLVANRVARVPHLGLPSAAPHAQTARGLRRPQSLRPSAVGGTGH